MGDIQLAARDAWFLYRDEVFADDSSMVMCGVYVFDTAGDPHPLRTRDELVGWANARLDRAPILRRRLHRVRWDLDYPFWTAAEDVEAADHVEVHEVGDTDRRALMALLDHHATQPVDLARPPWEIRFFTRVRGVDGVPEDATIALTRYHHAAADGLGAVQVTRALFDDPDARPATGGPNRARHGAVVGALRTTSQTRRLVGAMSRAVAARKEIARMVESGEMSMPSSDRPRTRFNVGGPGDRVVDVVDLRLSDVRRVARGTGTTVNDVLVTIVGGALHRYLVDCGERPGSSLAAHVPWAFRDRAGTRSANRIGAMIVDMHTDEGDPLARLRLVHQAASAEKERVRHPATVNTTTLLDHAPSIYLKSALKLERRRSRAADAEGIVMANTLITNVPRGDATLRLGNSPVIGGFGIAPIHRHARLAHAVTSLGDELTVCFTSDRQVMPDPAVYRAALRDEFVRLVERVHEAGPGVEVAS
ncbi:wax ester/triacylglycerol synthase domain-containing protein [Gordonia aurantiaca]|uniref:wax ester/triacylglycerol synthase domain-containing protein n=1 Tax=Gordonia sp. B21 TaxID=3151852 RepID=UPI003266A6F1